LSNLSQFVVNVFANLNSRYSGSGGQHKALIANLDKYEKVYKAYFGCELTGKYLVPAEWLTNGYKVINLSPNAVAMQMD